PHTFGIDELEPTVGCSERVPPMGVAVHENGAGRVVLAGAFIAVRNSTVDHASGARLGEVAPGGRDVFGEPGGLVRSGRDAIIVGSWPPERVQRGRDHVEDSRNRVAE